MNRYLPPLAVALGVAGLIPLIGCAVAAFAGDPRQTGLWLSGLVAYGAVVLSFLGAVHWGFALADDPMRVQSRRLLLGVVPALIGWAALMLLLVLPRAVSLGVLIAGFIATVAGESQGRKAGLVPPGYMWLRWGLTVVTVAVLITSLVLDLAQARINW